MEFINALVNSQTPFIRYALIAGVLSSIPFGIIGTYVVVNRMSYIAGAISHTALGGIGFALWLNMSVGVSFFSPIAGALVAAVFSGLIISFNLREEKERLDTVIGSIWAVGMSLGLIFIYLTPGYIDPMSYLFGNILLISTDDLWMIVFLNIVIVFFSVLFHNQFLTIFFDREFAKTKGVRTFFYQTILILLISLTVILLIRMVGIVLVIALLTIPAATADIFVHRMRNIILLAILLSLVIMTTGLFLSYVLELPTGSVTILVAGIIYVTARLVTNIRKPFKKFI